jgi:hypothetical protein
MLGNLSGVTSSGLSVSAQLHIVSGFGKVSTQPREYNWGATLKHK